MYKFKKLIAVALVFGVAAFFVVQDGANISLDIKYRSLSTPVVNTAEKVSISYVETAFAQTPIGLIYAGGTFKFKQKISHTAVYIQHPSGNFLFDTGLGNQIDEQFDAVPSLLKPILAFEKKQSAFDVLTRNGIEIEQIYLSHLHWDHASGLKDFSNAKIITTREEHDFAFSEQAEPPGFIVSQYDGDEINWSFMSFNSGPYEIFEKSYDLYDDGSIVFVKLGGHTNGSIGMFINLSEEKRYFFTGDLTWSQQGFAVPAEKFLFSRLMVDFDAEKVREQIFKISQLLENKPQIKVVPAHDIRSYQDFEMLD